MGNQEWAIKSCLTHRVNLDLDNISRPWGVIVYDYDDTGAYISIVF